MISAFAHSSPVSLRATLITYKISASKNKVSYVTTVFGLPSQYPV